jgi:hypothetical protein
MLGLFLGETRSMLLDVAELGAFADGIRIHSEFNIASGTQYSFQLAMDHHIGKTSDRPNDRSNQNAYLLLLDLESKDLRSEMSVNGKIQCIM